MILDVNLPGIDGFEVCRRIRLDSDTPVMMLTVRGEEADQGEGARPRRGRLPREAVQPAHAAGAGAGLLRRRGPERPAPLGEGRSCSSPISKR